MLRASARAKWDEARPISGVDGRGGARSPGIAGQATASAWRSQPVAGRPRRARRAGTADGPVWAESGLPVRAGLFFLNFFESDSNAIIW